MAIPSLSRINTRLNLPLSPWLSLMGIFRHVTSHSASSVRNMTTMASLRRISAKSLSEKILAEKDSPSPSYAIIDVRDDGMFIFQFFFFSLPTVLSTSISPPRLQMQGKMKQWHGNIHSSYVPRQVY
jgi:hypothetical protein